MALPANISTKTVTGKFIDLATGNAAAGSVTFTPSFASSVWLLDPAATTTIVPSPVTVFLDSTGAFSATLMCTNDPDASPINWTWHAELVCGSLTTEFDFSLPTSATSPVDLSQVATVPTIPAPASNFAKSVNGIFPDANGNITVFTVAPTILGNMSDVNAPTPGDLNILSYDLATAKWVKSVRLTSAESAISSLQTTREVLRVQVTSDSATWNSATKVVTNLAGTFTPLNGATYRVSCYFNWTCASASNQEAFGLAWQDGGAITASSPIISTITPRSHPDGTGFNSHGFSGRFTATSGSPHGVGVLGWKPTGNTGVSKLGSPGGIGTNELWVRRIA